MAVVVMFVVFAAAAVVWSLLVVVAIFTRRRLAFLAGSAVVVVAAAASVAMDVRALQLARGVQLSGVVIRIVPQDNWWKLEYVRNGASFVTANELHVPIGTAVTLVWSGLPPPWIRGAVCAPRGDDRCTLVAGDADAATFIGIWPPMWRHLPIVAEPRPRFEAWLRNEAQPARTSDAALFTSAGCAYCHVIEERRWRRRKSRPTSPTSPRGGPSPPRPSRTAAVFWPAGSFTPRR